MASELKKDTISNKQKLVIPMILLFLLMIFFGSITLYQNYRQIELVDRLNRSIELGEHLSNVIRALQRERGLSCGYVTVGSTVFKRKLLSERETVTKSMQSLKHFLSTNQMCTRSEVDAIEHLTANITEMRRKVDQRSVTYAELIPVYSKPIRRILEILVRHSSVFHVDALSDDIHAYNNLLYLKEYRGVERALGVALFAKEQDILKIRVWFAQNVYAEEEREKSFLLYASEDIKRYYHEQTATPVFQTIDALRQNIADPVSTLKKREPVQWYDMMTETLNAMDRTEHFIQQEVFEKARKIYGRADTFFWLTILVIAVSILVFGLLLKALIYLIGEERRLRLVTDKYIINSITDLNGKILDASDAFCRISGYTKEELIGKNHNIIRHPDMPPELFRQLWSTITNGYAWSGKIKNRKKDGSYYWVYTNVEPLYNARGEVDSYISIRLDITESEKLYQKVKEEEERNRKTKELMQQQSRLAQMGEMLNMIAHQWRQPLSAISVTASIIALKAKQGVGDSKELLEQAEKIGTFAQHLSQTIDDFREFFKPNKDKTNTDLQKILESVLMIVEGTLRSHNIELKVTTEEISSLYSYENELKQVVLNLIKNAEDALLEKQPDNPAIEVTVHGSTLKVCDNAGGIPDEIIGKIFDPYFSTKTKKDGTGLGLYMSKVIVEEHCSGTLSVENSQAGACFKITLPPTQA